MSGPPTPNCRGGAIWNVALGSWPGLPSIKNAHSEIRFPAGGKVFLRGPLGADVPPKGMRPFSALNSQREGEHPSGISGDLRNAWLGQLPGGSEVERTKLDRFVACTVLGQEGFLVMR